LTQSEIKSKNEYECTQRKTHQLEQKLSISSIGRNSVAREKGLLAIVSIQSSCHPERIGAAV